MNATDTTTAPVRRRLVEFNPTTPNFDQIPAHQRDGDKVVPISMKAGEKLAVRIYSYRGGLNDYYSKFTLGSVAEYAESYGEDPEVAVAKAIENGHDLYYSVTEAVVISLHRIADEPRTHLEVGTVIEMDGNCFQLLQTTNDNLKLVPFSMN